MKPLILLFFLAITAAAQTATKRTFVIPEFKVTAESLARAQGKPAVAFLYPPELRKKLTISDLIPQRVCLTMHSYNFDNSVTPKLVSETNCTMANVDGFLRVRQK